MLRKEMNIKNNVAVFLCTILIILVTLLLNYYLFHYKNFQLITKDYLLTLAIVLFIPYVLATINSMVKGYIDMSIKHSFKIAIILAVLLGVADILLVVGQIGNVSIINISSLLFIIGNVLLCYMIYYLIQNFAVKNKVIFHVIFIAIFLLSGIVEMII